MGALRLVKLRSSDQQARTLTHHLSAVQTRQKESEMKKTKRSKVWWNLREQSERDEVSESEKKRQTRIEE